MTERAGKDRPTARLRHWIEHLDGVAPRDDVEVSQVSDEAVDPASIDDVDELRRRLEASERQREHLETSLQLLETAFETMSMGVTITDLEGRIVYANPADARMHGHTLDDLVGRKAAEVYAAIGSESGEPLAGNGLWSRQRLDTTRDGRTFPVRLISDRVLGHDREPLGTITLCEDLGEQQRFKETLALKDGVLEALAVAAEKLLVDSSWEGVEKVLERLGRATGVDLIYILRVKEARPF